MIDLPEDAASLDALIERAKIKQKEIAANNVEKLNALIDEVNELARTTGTSKKELIGKLKTWSGAGRRPKRIDSATLAE